MPALFHNTVLGHTRTNNLVQVLLHGIERHGVDTVMPGFAHELSDQQITTLGNYLLTSYGNPAAKVTEQQVAQLRDPATAASDSSLVTLALWGMAIAVIVVLALIAFFVTRRRKAA